MWLAMELMLTLKSFGLRKLPRGRPEKVKRVLCKPKGEERKRFLLEKRKRIILQKLWEICRDKSWETNGAILTESKVPQMPTKEATRNVLSLKERYCE